MKLNLTTTLLALGATVSLTACSSGGDGGNGDPSYADYFDVSQALIREYGNTAYTSPSSLPTSGSSTYDGVLGANIAGTAVAGDLRLRADFGASSDQISGSVTDLVTEDEDRLSGFLTIDNGVIDRRANPAVEYTFEADIGGRVRNDASTPFDIDGVLRGDFFGRSYQAVSGEVVGTVRSGTDVETFDGDFGAER